MISVVSVANSKTQINGFPSITEGLMTTGNIFDKINKILRKTIFSSFFFLSHKNVTWVSLDLYPFSVYLNTIHLYHKMLLTISSIDVLPPLPPACLSVT
jgi:hypothetical protein